MSGQPMTEAMYYILLALLRPGYGYGMMQHGWIQLESEDARRKTYVITDTGREALRAEYDRLRRMVEDGAGLEGLL